MMFLKTLQTAAKGIIAYMIRSVERNIEPIQQTKSVFRSDNLRQSGLNSVVHLSHLPRIHSNL